MNERPDTCSVCKFYGSTSMSSPGSIHRRGGCRRHAPIGTGEGNFQWPKVEPDDWCGDFAPVVQRPSHTEAANAD